jgi:hypothetical protein
MSLVFGKRIGIDSGDADCAMRDLTRLWLISRIMHAEPPQRDKRRWFGQVLISIMRHSIVFLGNLTSLKAACAQLKIP